MAVAYQLEFFGENNDEIKVLKSDIEGVRESSEKVRKSLFARHGELARKYAELSERLQIIEKNICLGHVNPM